MAAPRPIDVMPIIHHGPSAADIASRVVSADPTKQAEAQAKISLAYHQKQVASTLQSQQPADNAKDDVPLTGNVKITGYAIVKAVPQADTLVLMGNGPAGKAPPEKTLILSGIIVPKIARRKDAVDEPYAFHAKEFMRKLVIGKRVKFTVTYIHAESGREYGTAELENIGDLTEQLIASGWAKHKPIKEPSGKNKDKDGKVKPEQERHEALAAKEAAAVESKLGVHAAKPVATAVRTIEHLTSHNDIKDFFNANRGQTLDCIVEQVREGSSLRLEFPGKTHKVFVLHLAGVQAPRIPVPKSGSPKNSEMAEPYALDAQKFTADRLLNRDVNVVLLGCDKLNNLFGSVFVAQGDIAVALLSKGLAKYIDWSASLTPHKAQLQAAEIAAKNQKLRLWSKFEAPQPADDIRGKQFSGKITQIASAETLIIEDGLKKEHRISLSSIRVPRAAYKDRSAEPWAAEGKEFMRKKLIGKKVRVSVDYVRDAPSESKDQETRVFASVFHGKENVGETLVANGFGSVVRHRMDEERSEYYEALQNAEERAVQAKKGIHGPNPSAAQQIVDLSERVRIPPKGASEEVARKHRDLTIKTKQFFSAIQRLGRVKAIVEYVFNGGRIKVFVPAHSHIFTFMLSYIRLPGGKGENDKLGEEATEFIKSLILQHDAEVEIDSMDKNDNYLGSLFIDRKNLSLLLLERGFARLVPRSYEKSKYAQELNLYQQSAQKARVGIWHGYDIEAEKKKAEEREAAFKKQRAEEKAQELLEKQQALEFVCTVSECFDPLDFYFQKVNDPNLPKIETALKSLAPYKGATFEPKRGMTCLAQFEDGTWYRAKVEKNILKGLYLVFFIDYGNRAEVTSVRPVPDNVPSLKSPACSHHAQLSGIKLSQDYLDLAIELFQEQTWGKQLQANVDATDRESYKAHVSLTVIDDESGERANLSINEYLVRSGAVRVLNRGTRNIRHVVEPLKVAEVAAKKDHLGIWEYGDVSSDEDEENVKSKDKRF